MEEALLGDLPPIWNGDSITLADGGTLPEPWMSEA
jgi:hypothetical protein